MAGARRGRAAAPEPPFRIDALTVVADGSAVAVRGAGVALGRLDPGEPVALGLRVGGTVDAQAWAALSAALARRGAFELGVRLLAARARTRGDLARRLRARFAEEAAAHALARLAPYLDDAAFARAWIEQRLRLRPAGSAALFAGLCRAGVEPALAQAAVSAATAPAGGERERCVDLARTRAARMRGLPPARAAARLWSFLARRGFSAEDIRAALREVQAVAGAPDPLADE